VAQKNAEVVPGSECVQVLDVHTGSYHKATRRAALFVKLSEYHRIDNTHATIHLVTYRHGLWAGGSTLLLETTPNGWVVSSKRAEWVS
jgi:hypothetical protein